MRVPPHRRPASAHRPARGADPGRSKTAHTATDRDAPGPEAGVAIRTPPRQLGAQWTGGRLASATAPIVASAADQSPVLPDLSRLEAWVPGAVTEPAQVATVRAMLQRTATELVPYTIEAANVAEGSPEEQAMIDRLHAQYDATWIDRMTTVLTRGFFSDHILEYHRLLQDMARKLSPHQDVVNAAIREVLDETMGEDESSPDAPLASLLADRRRFNQLLQASANADRQREIFLGRDDQPDAVAIRRILDRYRPLLTTEASAAQREMEQLVVAALDYLEIFDLHRIGDLVADDVMAGSPTTFQEPKLTTLIREIRRHVAIDLTPDIDSPSPASYTEASTLHWFDARDGFASRIVLRPGAPLSTLFHEILHAAPPRLWPDALRELVEHCRQAKRIEPPQRDKSLVDNKVAVEATLFLEEAMAFSGQVWLDASLPELYYRGCAHHPQLIKRFRARGVMGVYQELREHSAAYQLLEIRNSWQIAALMANAQARRALTRSTLSTEAGKWGLQVETTQLVHGERHEVGGVDLDRAVERLATTDLDGLRRLTETWLQDVGVVDAALFGGSGEVDDRLIRSAIAKHLLDPLDLPPAPRSLPTGNPTRIGATPDLTADQITLHATLRRLAVETAPPDLARFEAILAVAEQAPATAAPEWFEQAADLVRAFYARHDPAAEIAQAALGAALIGRGYTTLGASLIDASLDLLCEVEGYFLGETPHLPRVSQTDGANKSLQRLTRRLALTPGNAHLIRQLLRLIDPTQYLDMDDSAGRGYFVDACLKILPLLDELRHVLTDVEPALATEIRTAMVAWVRTNGEMALRMNPTSAGLIATLPHGHIPALPHLAEDSKAMVFDRSVFVTMMQNLADDVPASEAAALAAVLGDIPRRFAAVPNEDLVSTVWRLPRGLSQWLALATRQERREGRTLYDDPVSPAFWSYVLGHALIRHPHPQLHAAARQLLRRASEAWPEQETIGYVSTYRGRLPTAGYAYSPLARLVLADIDDGERLPYEPRGFAVLAALALVEAEPDHASAKDGPASGGGSNLGAAVRLAMQWLRVAPLQVRFTALPHVEFRLQVLQQLLTACLAHDQLALANKVAAQLHPLLDEYAAQYRRMLQQGAAWHRTLPPNATLLHKLHGKVVDFALEDALIPPLNAALAAFESPALPLAGDSVGSQLELTLRTTLARHRVDTATLDRCLNEIEDDTTLRKGHLSDAALLRCLRALLQHEPEGQPAQRLARICIRRFALQRGAGARAHAAAQHERVRSAANTLANAQRREADDLDDFYDHTLRAARLHGAAAVLRSAIVEPAAPGDPAGADRALAEAIAAFCAVIESSPLDSDAREQLYVELVERFLPQRTADWMELWRTFPHTFHDLLSHIQDRDYPRVEATLARRIAATTPDLLLRPDQPGANQALLAALSTVCRGLAARRPEVLCVDHLPHLLRANDSLTHQTQLHALFGPEMREALRGLGTRGSLGLSYHLGDLLAGDVDPARAVREMETALDRLRADAATGTPKQRAEVLRIYQELLRQALLGHLPKTVAEPLCARAQAQMVELAGRAEEARTPLDLDLLGALVAAQDPREALEKRAWYYAALAGTPTPDLEALLLRGLQRSGAVSDYIYNEYLQRYCGAPEATRAVFRGLLLRLRDYGTEVAPADYFVVQLLEQPDLAPFALARFERWSAAVRAGHPWIGDDSNPWDLAIFYYHVLTAQDRERFTLDEMIRQLPSLLRYDRGETTAGYAAIHAAGVAFPQEQQQGMRFLRQALREFIDAARAVNQRLQVSALHLPVAVLELPPVVQFIAVRYLHHLPLGVREDLLAVFADPRIEAEEAFRLLFELTGNQKLGQFLSLLTGAIPERFRLPLKQFRAQNRPPQFAEVEAAFIQDRGVPLEQIFSRFDPAMKSAGSIGAVYAAELPAGYEVHYYNEAGEEVIEVLTAPRRVAVKVIVPAHQQHLEDNLRYLRACAADLATHADRFGLRFDPIAVVEDFIRTLQGELDLRREMALATLMRGYAVCAPFQVPRYYTNLTTPHITVIDWVDGVPLDQVADPNRKRALFFELARMTATNVFQIGIFYEDPHPDNVLVSDTAATLIDFGRLGQFTPPQREALLRFIAAISAHHVESVIAALPAITQRGRAANPQRLASDVREIWHTSRVGFDNLFATMDAVFTAAFAAGYYVHPAFTQMLKTFLTLQGVAAEDPDLSFPVADILTPPFMLAWQRLLRGNSDA